METRTMETAALESLKALEAQHSGLEGLLRKQGETLNRHRLLLERTVDRAVNGSFKGSSAPNSPLDDITGSRALSPRRGQMSSKSSENPSPRFCWERRTGTSSDEDSDDSETFLERTTMLARAQDSFRDLRKTVKTNLATRMADLIEDSVVKKQRNIVPRNKVQELLLPIVHNVVFQFFVFIMIWTQVILITLQLNLMMQKALDKEYVDLEYRVAHNLPETNWTTHLTWLQRAEGWVLIVFVAEVLLRLLAEQTDFFRGHNSFWNVSDALIASLSLIYTLWDRRSTDLSTHDQFRVVRVLRCFRALHMIRILKPFRRLRVMFYSIMACLGSLVWALVLMFIIVLLFSIYFMDVALLHIQLHNLGYDDVIQADEKGDFMESVRNHWGCMYDAWLSLLYSVTGGADWSDLAKPFYMINPVHSVLYLIYVIVITLGLVNITVGVFARQAQDFYQWDPHLIVEGAHSDHESTRTCLHDLFAQMDESGNGTLSKREIKAGMNRPFTKAYFAHLNIDIEMNPDEFFMLLDTDGNDKVDIEEFVQTCMRLQGGAKPLELQRILNNLSQVDREVNIIKANLEEKFSPESQRSSQRSLAPSQGQTALRPHAGQVYPAFGPSGR